MALKEDIEQIKSEIVGEGKFLEYFMHFERFYKKYKFLLWGVIIALVVAFAYSKYTDYQNNQRVIAANQAFVELMKDSSNSSLQSELKAKSDTLYKLFNLNRSIEASDKEALAALSSESGIVGKLANYHLASIEKDVTKLQTLRADEGSIFDDFSILQTAYIYVENGEYLKAQEEVGKLPFNSQFKTNGDIISHFGVTQ